MGYNFHTDLSQSEGKKMVRPGKLAEFKGNVTPVVQKQTTTPAQNQPGLVAQAIGLTDATAKWIKAGRPTRPPDRVEALYTICQGCPHFKPVKEGRGYCGLCGCGCHAHGTFLNKLAWSTETCPDDPPRWLN